MGWNGSGDTNAAPVPKKTVKTPPSKWRGLVALVVIVAFGGAGVWWFVGGRARTSPPTMRADGTSAPTEIAEVKPQIATNKTAKVEECKSEELPPQRVGEIRNGMILLSNGKLHRPKGVLTNTHEDSKPRYAIFKHRCDNEIASVLMARPGALVFGEHTYKGRFKDEFVKSLEEPITISQDDSEEDAEIKRLVCETKAEMKAALDRGEDIEQMMSDAREELRKLWLYKNDINQQLQSFRRNKDVTDDDVADFAEACNTMLEEKGIEPIKIGPLVRRNLKLKQGEMK